MGLGQTVHMPGFEGKRLRGRGRERTFPRRRLRAPAMSSAPTRRRPHSLGVAGASAASSLVAVLRSEEPGSGLSPLRQVG